jgi:hypothetical protein
MVSPPTAPSTSLPYGIKKKKYQPPTQTKRLNWNQVNSFDPVNYFTQNKRQRIQKGQSQMDNPEKLAT